jgi:hypothetical protein
MNLNSPSDMPPFRTRQIKWDPFFKNYKELSSVDVKTKLRPFLSTGDMSIKKALP